MLDGADENPQPSDTTDQGPRHLRSRHGRPAAHLRVLTPDPQRLAATRAWLRTGSVRLQALTTSLRRRADPAHPAHPARLWASLSTGARRGVVAAAVVAVAAFGLSVIPDSSGTPASIAGAEVSVTSDAGGADATGDAAAREKDRSSRSGRTDAAAPKDAGTKAAAPKATAQNGDKPSAAAPAPAPTKPAPVGGLSQAEMDNAVAIVDVAKLNRLPKRAAVVALATALQESHLRNLANGNLPQSLNHPNQGVGYDYDSVGLFQQRPNWGTIDQLMDPHESARRFYAALLSIPGWGDYAVTVAAQMVQGSAFPDAYAKWEGLANQIADATM